MFRAGRKHILAAIVACAALWAGTSHGQSVTNNSNDGEIRIVELQGKVEISLAGSTNWAAAQTNQILHAHDRLRTGMNSRMALRWADQSVVPFGALTELEILPPHQPEAQSGLHLIQGVISFFHRDKPGRIRVITRGAVAGIEGTEFVLATGIENGVERTTLSVIDGKVEFGNAQATLVVTNHQQAVAEPGKAPVRTAGFIANNVLQWSFYYPAVLNLADLPLTPEEQSALGESLNAYQTGDLLAALEKYPATRQPGSDAERVYYSALLLSVGEVEKAEATLASITAPVSSRPRRLANALRLLVATVKCQAELPIFDPILATEFLANSYYEQSLALPGFALDAALDGARRAASAVPQFGFAWTRVAELEFSFGHTSQALEALEKGLALSPRNAQAIALKGFLLAAQGHPRAAVVWFDRALAVDSSLGNAWLGRGLCRIHCGDRKGGREDLLVAAALEPQRSSMRSYLGKAYAATGDFPHATKELELAKKLDPKDPTAWLYSALLHQERNRINEAIRDLEKSMELNDNRSIYRSQLLLDQDRAVRGANLAAIYRDAGMSDVAMREAARSVNNDYANYSAHHFLANSYHELGDPNRINRRYETSANNEYLLANLLAPVSAGPLSPAISQQEYSQLFERDRMGVVSSTEYLSRGAWTESGAQYGTFGNFNYDVEAFYRSDPGQWRNNDKEERWLSAAMKLQITSQDSLYLQVQHYEAENGDLHQYYDPQMANPDFRVKERQEPIVYLGYHHEWSPGVHTLFFAARLDDTLSITNPAAPTYVANRPDIDPDAMPGITELTSVQGITMHERFENELAIYSGELQQIWQYPLHTTLLGARIQEGRFHTENYQNAPSSLGSAFPPPPLPAAQQDDTSLFRRVSFYGYHHWQVFDSLQLVGGVAYDRLTFPENFCSAPISTREKTVDQVSPKAGFIWTPAKNTTVRFAYTRSLSGASVDQSYQLEPSQMAGFVQSYRSIIPESVAGPNAGARLETFGLSLEQKFKTGTYLGISGELLNSEVHRTVGAFDVLPDQFDWAVPSGLREHLDYREPSFSFTANQLVGKSWSFGAQYRLSQAVLKDNFVDVSDGLLFDNFQPRQRLEGILNQINLFGIYNHPKGFFAKGEALWRLQDNQDNVDYTPDKPGDNFWQFNAFAGYRSPRRRVEITAGLLNITDQDYKLDPLNIHNELPRERTFVARLRISF